MRAGQRIRLIKMPDDPDPIEPGAEGMITRVVLVPNALHPEWTQVEVDWDNGRSLALSIPPDEVQFLGDYHQKVSLDSVACGESIFGKLTNAEGYTVTCSKCLERISNAAN